MSRVYMSKAVVGAEEEAAVVRALRSGWVAPLGPEVDAFEAEICLQSGRDYALALSSGTAALHVALLNLGAKPGSFVVLPTMTFAATANAVAYTGAEPVFVDSFYADGNVNTKLLVDAVRTLQNNGKHVAAAVTVDLFGRCADYDGIESDLVELDVPILADAAESLGSSLNGRPAGSFGIAAAFSFNGNKIATTSGGGMLVSDDKDFIDRARYLSTQARQPVLWYEHTEVGFNYRMSNILAALGRVQLGKLDSFVARRRSIRNKYVSGLGDIPGLRFLDSGENVDGHSENCWLTAIDLGCDVGLTVDEIVRQLDSRNIEARHLWKPMHLQPLWKDSLAFIDGSSESLFNRGIALPSGAGLEDWEIELVIDTFRSVLGQS